MRSSPHRAAHGLFWKRLGLCGDGGDPTGSPGTSGGSGDPWAQESCRGQELPLAGRRSLGCEPCCAAQVVLGTDPANMKPGGKTLGWLVRCPLAAFKAFWRLLITL